MSQHSTDSHGRDLTAANREFGRTLLAVLFKHTGDAHGAEDLLHDVMLKVLASEKAGRPAPENIGAWLYMAARNAPIDWHRARRPSEELPEDLAATADEESEAGLELANCLRPMAERLPAHYRDTLLVTKFEGQPLKQIAEAHGISLAAAKTRASRGGKLLLQELVRCCRVVLSDSGQVLGYDPRAVSTCAPAPGGCGEGAGGSCK